MQLNEILSLLNEMPDLTKEHNSVSSRVVMFKSQILNAKNLQQAYLIFMHNVLDPSIVGHGTSRRKYDEYVQKARDCRTLKDMHKLINEIEKGGMFYRGRDSKPSKTSRAITKYLASIPPAQILPSGTIVVDGYNFRTEKAARSFILTSIGYDRKFLSMSLVDLIKEYLKRKP